MGNASGLRLTPLQKVVSSCCAAVRVVGQEDDVEGRGGSEPIGLVTERALNFWKSFELKELQPVKIHQVPGSLGIPYTYGIV